MKKILLFKVLILLISATSLVQAQQLIGLGYNDAIKKHIASTNSSFKSATKITYQTPPFPDSCLFFEDFSYYPDGVYPNPGLWRDSSAFINQTYADSCISIGVATLDAMDRKGNIYAKNDSPINSDTLTSQNISLAGISSPLFLSFFIQGGGKGEAPDPGDSLILEFSNINDTTWVKLWDTSGYESHSFKQIIIPLTDEKRGTNFKFRFRNITSLDIRNSPGGSESGLTNADLWHIDYIQIKKAANIDEVRNIEDIAYTEPLKSPYNNYSAVPYSHLTFVHSSLAKTTIDIQFRNSFNSQILKVYRNYESWDIYKGKKLLLNAEGGIGGFENNELPLSFSNYSDSCTTNFSYIGGQEYGHFEVKSFFEIDDEEQYLWNDTIKRQDIYRNYYAYDDGTAEYGFGMPGSGGYNMRLAYKYFIYQSTDHPDTLTAIDIHFNKSRNNAQNSMQFRLGVWSNHGTVPGDTLYLSDEFNPYSPDTSLVINEFQRILLSNEILVADTIYIGIVQLGYDFINIGYDVNNNSISNMYINGGNGWQQVSQELQPGSLMIRPVFGHKLFSPIKTLTKTQNSSITIYPNPAQETITLVPPENEAFSEYSVSIFDLMGRMVLFYRGMPGEVSIEELQPGMYFIQAENLFSRNIYSQKFLKTE